MNIIGNNAGKLNEIIFANRNKQYGAYAIRSEYTDSLKKSISCLIGLVVVLFGSVMLKNHLNTAKSSESPLLVDDVPLKPLTYVTPVDLTPLTKDTKKNEESAAAKGTVGTIINDNAVETNSVNLDQSLNGVGTETATGTSLTSTKNSAMTSTGMINTSSPASIETVVVAEEMPEFEGGISGLMKYVSQNIIYPSLAREIGKEGTVYVSFIVSETGQVENVNVMRGIGYGCDEEVVRVIGKMPRWKKVGKNAGHPVKVRFNIPVSFRLR